MADDLTAMPRQLPAANWSQAGIRRLGCLQRQVLRLQEPLAKPSWRPAFRPKPTSRFAAQLMLNVSFVEASAMSVVCHLLRLDPFGKQPSERLLFLGTCRRTNSNASAIATYICPSCFKRINSLASSWISCAKIQSLRSPGDSPCESETRRSAIA